MIGGVTRRMLPLLSGVPHLHVNRPLRSGLEGINNNMQNIQDYLLEYWYQNILLNANS